MKSTLITLLLLLPLLSCAQDKPIDAAHTNLDSLSMVYYTAGDDYFLAIDAVKDRLIDPAKPFLIKFADQKLTVNEHPITDEAIVNKYKEKVKQLLLVKGVSVDDADLRMSVTGACVCVASLPNPILPESVRKYINAERKLNDSLITARLLAAKIINHRRDKITISATDDATYVNKKQLTIAQERAITPYLNQETFLDNMEADFASGKVTPVTDPDKHNFLYSFSR